MLLKANNLFEGLPFEILLLIAQYISFNFGVDKLRLISAQINALVTQDSAYLLHEFCDYHGIDARLLNLYFNDRGDSMQKAPSDEPLQQLLCLSSELQYISVLSTDLDRQQRFPIFMGPAVEDSGSPRSFLLFSVLTETLKSSVKEPVVETDLLAPSSTIDDAVPVQLSSTSKKFLYDDIALHELEAIIIAINVCATRLWSSISLNKPCHAQVDTFASLGGHPFNTEQAILTEHVIWRGPRWVSRFLQPGKENLPLSASLEDMQFHDLLNRDGPWRGCRAVGARLAANGIARLLWKERQRKFENKITSDSMTHMVVNPVVWRGSSGDM